MLTDEEVLHTRNDVEMIKRPHLWPYRVLPLKRYNGITIETAVLTADEASLPGPLTLRAYTTIFGGGDPELIEFDSSETIVAAGWRVD